jgi:aladin
MFPHLAMSNDSMIERFSINPNWSTGIVRCFAWHPHAPKFAVALHDDTVCVHQAHPTDIVPVLKHKMQKGVADLAWKPMSASLLAVACQSCILLWTVDPMSLATRPSASCAQILTRPGHSPITSLAWSPVEDVLVSASPSDNAIMIWGTTLDMCLPIKRVGRGGVTLLRWSPEGSKLFTACPSSVFRVWQCSDWTADRWTRLFGRCQVACWSPDGSALLFATTDQALIYCVIFATGGQARPSFNIAPVGMSESAIPIVDLSPIERQLGNGSSVRIGGIVQTMAWDQNGERLAVVCQVPSASFVAIFHTRLHPTFELLPCGFVRGLPDEQATMISFKPNFDDGSLLTVVWSSGRIAHIPLYYVPRARIAQSHDASFQKQSLRFSPFSS